MNYYVNEIFVNTCLWTWAGGKLFYLLENFKFPSKYIVNSFSCDNVVKILSHFEVKLRETELKSSVIQFWYPDTMTKCKRYIWIVMSLKYLLAILHTFVKLSLEEFRCLSRLFLLKWSAVIFNSNCLNLQ